MKKYVLFVILTLGINSFAQQVIYVDSAATGVNDGSSWQNAFTDVQDAISNANTGDEVWVSKGTYYPTEDIIGDNAPTDPRTKTFLINKEIAIYGGFSGTETSITQRNWEINLTKFSGDIGVTGDKTDNCHRVVFVTNSSSIDGLIIEDSYVPNSYGGALNVNGSNFLLNNCLVRRNETTSGAGMYIQGNGAVQIINSEFRTNTSANKGGAIFLETGNIQISNSIFDDNSSGYGGALCLEGGTTEECVIVNSLFTNNQTTQYGGTSIFAYNMAEVKIVNSTFAKNYCPSCSGTNTGTIRSNDVNFIVQNSIVWNSNPFSESSNDLSKFNVNNSILPISFSGNNNLSIYPLFEDSTNNDFNLQSNSAAIQAGDTLGFALDIPFTDLNGDMRYVGGTIDIGCFENQTIAGIQDQNDVEFTHFPNPVNSIITLGDEGVNIDKIIVLDLLGKIVLTRQFPSNTIDISELKAGTYLFQVYCENNMFNLKIIKE